MARCLIASDSTPVSSVSMKPGATALTVIDREPNSRARLLASARWAALAGEYSGRLKVVKVNVDENPRLAQQFDARSIPTLVVLRDGRPVDRIVGALPKDQLVARLLPHLLRA